MRRWGHARKITLAGDEAECGVASAAGYCMLAGMFAGIEMRVPPSALQLLYRSSIRSSPTSSGSALPSPPLAAAAWASRRVFFAASRLLALLVGFVGPILPFLVRRELSSSSSSSSLPLPSSSSSTPPPSSSSSSSSPSSSSSSSPSSALTPRRRSSASACLDASRRCCSARSEANHFANGLRALALSSSRKALAAFSSAGAKSTASRRSETYFAWISI
mmetsp:Transcript_49300/g.128619  ORF Transcript_49300/g.128619 Transcript_49300/m.128619 type:complete len:219 (-) Transcript_49300:791-1447(-)